MVDLPLLSRRRRLAAGALLVALLPACGSTVTTAATGLPGTVVPGQARDGLSLPATATSGALAAAAAVDGAALPGASSAPGVPGRRAVRPQAAVAPVVAAGGSAVTGELRIGITYAETGSTASALGASSDRVDGRSTALALVRALNAEGGLAGRRLTPVLRVWDTSSNDYAADAAAACESFTRDEKVSVVLDSVFGTTGGFGDCLHAAGVLHVTSTTEGDRTSSARRPLHVNTQLMTDDRTYSAVLEQLSTTGYLSSRHRIGLLLEQCPSLERAYEHSILPLVDRLGLQRPVVRGLECTSGFGSAGPAAATISNAILAFRQAGVDRVLLMSDFETVLLLLFANSASSQDYRPGYLLSSTAQAEATRGSIPRDQWPQLRGVGVAPGGDVVLDTSQLTAVERRCARLATAGGLRIATQNDRTYVHLQCGTLLLLEAALRRTGGRSEPSGLAGAIAQLGTGHRSPGLVSGATRFGPGRYDGPAAVRVFGYAETCSCLKYEGPARPAPA